MEGESRGRDVAAVGAAHDRDLIVGHPILVAQPLAAGDDIPEVRLAVGPVVHVEEGLAVTGRAPVVGRQHRIAVVHQMLDHGRIAAPRLAAGAAVDQDDGRDRRVSRGAVGTVKDARDHHPALALVADDGRLDEVGLVDFRIEGMGQAAGLAGREIGCEDVGRRGVRDHREGDGAFVVIEPDARQVAVRHAGQGDRPAGRCVGDGQVGRGVGVESRDLVAAGGRIGDKHHVPVSLDDGRVGAGRQIAPPGLVPLAVLVGAVDQGRAVGRELIGAIGDVAVVVGDEHGLARALEVDEVDVAVGGGVGLVDHDPAAVVGDGRREELAGVLEQDAALQGRGVIGHDVESRRIAGVGRQVEGRAVAGPAEEAGLEVLAGRQVDDRAVLVADIDVVQLVAALVGGEQDPAVMGKVADGEGRVVGRGGQRDGVAAREWQGVGVEHAGSIRGDQDVGSVRGEGVTAGGRHAVTGRLEELGRGVGGVGRGGGGGRLLGQGSGGGQAGQEGEYGDDDGAVHGEYPQAGAPAA